MSFVRIAFTALALAAFTGSAAAAEDSGRFLVRLGNDTTGVERYTRTASQVDVQQVGRAPRVLRRHFVFDYAGGALTHVSVTVTAPGGTAPTQTVDGSADADSFRVSIRNGTAPAQSFAVPLPRGALVVSASSPWTGYESVAMRLAQGHSDTLSTRMYYLGAPGTNVLTLRRMGRDSVELKNDHQDVFHLRVDRAGRLLAAVPISGTGKFTVTRVASLDVDGLATVFAGREKSGAGLGTLSPRDTVSIADAGGAHVWVDYGRPAMRGRVVYGGIVPWDEVWRTGANAATQFRTDKALDFGGTVIPPGLYTLWTVPSPKGWKLLVNTQTGQWGTEHDAARDAFTVSLATETLPDPEERFTIHVVPRSGGGVLQLDWATTRATAEFKTAP